MLTGARRGEVAAMSWNELDLVAGTWHLSDTRAKNRQNHTVYLSPLAVELISVLKSISGNSSFVFDNGCIQVLAIFMQIL